MNSPIKSLTFKVSSLALLVVSVSIVTAAQTQAPWAGKYEGTAKGPNGDVQLTLNLVHESGKFSGDISSPHATYKVVKSQFAEGVLILEAEGDGTKGKMTLSQKDGKLAGEFTADGRTGPVEFRRVTIVKDEISGVWDAAADAQGQAFPFTLTLKLDGEKITGSSNSSLGESNISSGIFKDGKLTFILEGGNGQIAMTATMTDGKLVGDFDYAGQLSGKWVAAKKQ
jgi:hypothetical protein